MHKHYGSQVFLLPIYALPAHAHWCVTPTAVALLDLWVGWVLCSNNSTVDPTG